MWDRLVETYHDFNATLAEMPEWFQSLFGSHASDFILQGIGQTFLVGFFGWSVATFFERRHFKDIEQRENALKSIRLSTNKSTKKQDANCVLLTGSVMVSHDLFRTLIIMIRKIIGGNVSLYERLSSRGRREAILRLKEEAQLRGIDEVINIRLDSVKISARFLSGIAMTATGTGIKENTAQ